MRAAAQVLHDVMTSALVVQPPVREWRRALLAYDGTSAARRAMEVLGGLAVGLDLEVASPNTTPSRAIT